tara:strand:+ start:17813 stop:17974 length:162 start_codon:yes stop_codon:yes gene_type:complete
VNATNREEIMIKFIKCGYCGSKVSTKEALELEYCPECEEELDIPDECYEYEEL